MLNTQDFMRRTALATVLLASPALYADSTTAQFDVTSTVVAACSVDSATNLAFGSYDLTDTDGTSTVSVTCTNGSAYRIDIDGGGSANPNARTMSDGGGNSLNYALYQDSGRSSIWGINGDGKTATGTGTSDSHIVYGRIPAGQTAPEGSYSDTVTVTVYFNGAEVVA